MREADEYRGYPGEAVAVFAGASIDYYTLFPRGAERQKTVRASVQRILDAMTAALGFVRNGRVYRGSGSRAARSA